MNLINLKNKFNSTSEELLGITKQPEYQCPNIDKTLRVLYDIKKEILGYTKGLKYSDNEEVIKIANDIEWSINMLDIDYDLEKLRKSCEEIRTWGQEWKNLSKKLIAKQDDISNLLSDEYYLKLEKND